MGSLDKSDEYLREAKWVAEELYLDDVSTIIDTLKEADKDRTKTKQSPSTCQTWRMVLG